MLKISQNIKTAQRILMDTKLTKTANLCVEIMNSKRRVMGKHGRSAGTNLT